MDGGLPDRLPPFGVKELPWLPPALRRFDWTCDQHKVVAMEVTAAAIWARLRREGLDAKAFEFKLPGNGATVRPGDVVHYDLLASGVVAHRAIHVGLGFIVHVWRSTAKCSCREMTPPGVHNGPGTRAHIALSRMEDNPWFAQAWYPARTPAGAPPPAERVYRALASIGSVNYNLLYANCDHFVDAVLSPGASRRARPSRIVIYSTIIVCVITMLLLAALHTAALHRMQPRPPRLRSRAGPRGPGRPRPEGGSPAK